MDLYSQGNMFPNSTRSVSPSNTPVSLDKLHIHEQELEAVKSHTPVLNKAITSTLVPLLQPLWPNEDYTLSVKVQVNTGGSFSIHTDSDGVVDSRVLSGVLYLNDHQPSHGGHLRVYPLPHDSVDIAPAMDTLVLFSSVNMLHRVLPSTAPARVCCLFWVYSESAPALDQPPTLVPNQLESLLPVLDTPKLRYLATKFLYAGEWAESLERAHAPSEQLTDILAQHWKEVAAIAEGFSALPVSQYLPLTAPEDTSVQWFQ